MKKTLLLFLSLFTAAIGANAQTATEALRPSHIDLSGATSESAVLMTLNNYSTADARFKIYNGSSQYNSWDEASEKYITSSGYSDGAQIVGDAKTSTTFWILFQRGSNASSTARYRDRLGPDFKSNFKTVDLSSATEITTPFELTGTFTGSNLAKHVVLGFSGTNLICASSTNKADGSFNLVCPDGTTIDKVEIRAVDNTSLGEVTGNWTSTTAIGDIDVPVGGDPIITILPSSLSNFECYSINTNPSEEKSFKVSGSNLTDGITIKAPTNYEMSLMSGFIAPATSQITLAQASGTVDETTIYVRLKGGLTAGDYNEDITLSSTDADNKTVSCTGKVIAPMTTTLPYTEDFTNDLDNVYTYTVAGNKPWSTYNNAAQGNGYKGANPEEQWLILKGVDFSAYVKPVMTFNTEYNFGNDDANNYLKLMYSTDYPGLGDPSGSTWVELDFTKPSAATTKTESGIINLTAIADEAYIAFKYYSTTAARRWTIDDIEIIDQDKATAIGDTKATELKVGPNPFNNELRIESASDIKTVRLFNTAGQVIKNVTGFTKTIETADVPVGLYILQIEFTDDSSVTQKVIKK